MLCLRSSAIGLSTRARAWRPSGAPATRDAPSGSHHSAVLRSTRRIASRQRGGDGTPSATDYLLHDLPTVIDLLAEDFVGRTSPVADDPEIRVLIAAGVLVPFVAVYALLAADDAVEVIYIELG